MHHRLKEFGKIESVVRAKNRRKIPVVFSKSEIKALFDNFPKDYILYAKLIYGGGLRVTECVRLRVHDADFGNHILIIKLPAQSFFSSALSICSSSPNSAASITVSSGTAPCLKANVTRLLRMFSSCSLCKLPAGLCCFEVCSLCLRPVC